MELRGCEGLDEDLVRRLLDLELSTSTYAEDRGPSLRVALTCGPDSVAISLGAPTWSVEATRRVPLPGGDAGDRERLLAITVAQFAKLIWAGAPEPAAPASATSTVPDTSAEAKGAVAGSDGIRSAVAPSAKRPFAIGLGGGARGRALDSAPWATGTASLRFALPVVERLLLAVDVSFEGGRSRRDAGDVDAYATSVVLAGQTEIVDPRRRFRLAAVVGIASGFCALVGRPKDPSWTGETARGYCGDVSVAIASGLRAPRLSVTLALEGGYGFPALAAKVRGESTVTFGGFWTGAQLAVTVGSSAGDPGKDDTR
jgi:hypothetical protein